MPRKNGFDVLAWLKTRASLLRMPVVVLSGSALEKDKEPEVALGARDFKTKPCVPEDYTQLAKELHTSWLSPSPSPLHALKPTQTESGDAERSFDFERR